MHSDEKAAPTVMRVPLGRALAPRVVYHEPLYVLLDGGAVAACVTRVEALGDAVLCVRLVWTTIGELAFEGGRQMLGAEYVLMPTGEIGHVTGFHLLSYEQLMRRRARWTQ